MSKRFEGKKCVVTGGTSGIGLAAAKRLLAEGGRVLVTGQNEARLAEAEALGLVALKNNAGKAEDAEALAAAVKETLGTTVDCLFLNAGFAHFQAVEAATATEFDAMFDTNVKGPLLETRCLAPLVADGGSICVNTSTIHAMGAPGTAIYSATKGALRAMVRVMCKEFAPRKIRVNAVAPGLTATNIMEKADMTPDQMDAFAESMIPSIPLARMGTADESANVALFLLSDDASYVTGSEYNCDGGLTEV